MKPTRVLAPEEKIKEGDLAITNHGEVIVIEGKAVVERPGIDPEYLLGELEKIRKELWTEY